MSGAVGAGAVTAGSGQIAGIGVANPSIPNQAEPGVDLRKKKNPLLFKSIERRRKPATIKEEVFAGHTVFEVDSHTFYAARLGKRKWARWANYIGDDEIGRQIKRFAYKYPQKPIILKNAYTGAMLFLRYPNAQR